MKDLLPPEAPKWRFIEATAREAFAAFGFNEIRVPLLERTELFARSIGEETDIVSKEMYTFEDRGGDSLTMRPEATAGVARAFLEHKLHAAPGPHKLFTIGPMFRHERPQKGRLRQFHQLDCEVLDDAGPQSDAELLVLADHLLKNLGVSKVEIVLNSLGCRSAAPSSNRRCCPTSRAKRAVCARTATSAWWATRFGSWTASRKAARRSRPARP